jgi:hypothetical protein
MRSNDRLRSMWRDVEGPAPTTDARIEWLTARIGHETQRALRARNTWQPRSALAIGLAAMIVAAVATAAVAAMPAPAQQRPATTLLGAISGHEIPDGAWVISAAIRTTDHTTEQ